MTVTKTRRALLPALAALGLAAVPGAAQAAQAPGVSATSATKITQTTARLTGKVNPRDVQTTYVFQYGPTTAYGTTTAPVAVGGGTANKAAAADVGGLAPASKYHFRLVARSGAGTTSSADRTFTTDKQPLGLTLEATPNPVPYGAATAINGVLSGTDNAGKQVSLLQNQFPFTAGFAPVAGLNAQVISETGTFSFPIPALTITSQYMVTVADRPNVTSPILTVAPTVTVNADVSTRSVKRGRSIRFAGSITPRRDGARFAIQKLNSEGAYVTVGGGITRAYTDTKSKFAKRVKVSRGGTYRVFVGLDDGDVANGVSRTFKVRSHR